MTFRNNFLNFTSFIVDTLDRLIIIVKAKNALRMKLTISTFDENNIANLDLTSRHYEEQVRCIKTKVSDVGQAFFINVIRLETIRSSNCDVSIHGHCTHALIYLAKHAVKHVIHIEIKIKHLFYLCLCLTCLLIKI